MTSNFENNLLLDHELTVGIHLKVELDAAPILVVLYNPRPPLLGRHAIVAQIGLSILDASFRSAEIGPSIFWRNGEDPDAGGQDDS